jgi:hypothetical protein
VPPEATAFQDAVFELPEGKAAPRINAYCVVLLELLPVGFNQAQVVRQSHAVGRAYLAYRHLKRGFANVKLAAWAIHDDESPIAGNRNMHRAVTVLPRRRAFGLAA